MLLLSFIIVALLLSFPSVVLSLHPEMKTFIVQVRPPPPPATASKSSVVDLEKWYRSFLPQNPAADSITPRMVYMYSEAITGFAARLTDEEVEEMSSKEGFLMAHPDRIVPLLTTHTPSFLGLNLGSGFWSSSNYGKGVIIGVLDTGVFAAHPSFHDDGMPPPPPKWKGGCDSQHETVCNNKLIGVKSFASTQSATDEQGHGTHTASTAAGNFVKKANVLGNGNGTAAGMAPRAHLSVYKACDRNGCYNSVILAAMDAAIKDGVDVLSISLGANRFSFDVDAIAIAAFRAVEKGIFVSCAAGNSGPSPNTMKNEAPWILTVGASTMDRNIRVTVKLGDGQEIHGQTAFQPNDFSSVQLPLVYPEDTGIYGTISNCYEGAFDNISVKGKAVLCQLGTDTTRIDTGEIVKEAGGAAMILMNNEPGGFTTMAEAHRLPAAHVSYADQLKILSYLNSSSKPPTVSLAFKGTVTGVPSAPTVASFSSRGPSNISPRILKPDIIGPGVSVVAAWPFDVGPPSMKGAATTSTPFNIISGTSMSTPHLSGIAALVKSEHPDWSPAAIKSAIMTTSDTTCRDGGAINDEQHKPASYFSMGAGHVNPSKATDPGLVYDLDPEDYVPYLCGLGYTNDQVEAITGHDTSCAKKIKERDLNYPSIMVDLGSKVVMVNRTVTNVGEASSTYTVNVEMPDGVSVTVSPKTLEFSKVKEKKSFTVSIRGGRERITKHIEGKLEWVSDKHVVRSPLVITPPSSTV